jgi:Ca2+-binding RTX toxin-like protein
MTLIGTNGPDLLIHDTSERIEIRGKRGDDTLVSEHGNGAIMFGGRGADTLDGGPGFSLMLGGKGRDEFVFNDEITSRLDNVIGDFKSGKDRIVLDLNVFGDVRDHDWFGTVIEQDGHVLTYNGEVFVVLRGNATVAETDFLFT